ncbi:probable cysteine--tRNA ligase, mitochondrial [Pectinophora gossypiella]|uniref:probable cysteine--tRNA ligase, mitochondrial n=1 Tax=Pectinophora gossypiella TaxID=13191 RepID=UPI00214E3245|nr:probable cysteine--tRNA ligase, mitochondrial [Pectinophora gossypiella]
MRKILPIFSRKLSHVCNLKPYKETKWLMPIGNPTGLYVYNCVAEQKVPVILNDPHIATWYSCGPTVYDSAHLGHASCYVKLDIVQRILKTFLNIKLVTAMGVTDIDDKIIRKGLNTNTDYRTVAKQYEHEFWLDMAKLNVEKPMIITRVSDHISSIESFVKTLLDNQQAYATNDGTVYFDTSKFPYYGKLQKMQDSSEPISKHKRNNMDFALWKGHKPDEPYWTTSWGKGRPGWHIECSAMVSKVFGSQIDFHAGGIDLLFPHHENEEAQSCAYHNKRQWANYWIHVGHLHVKGDVKMSKSLKNTVSIPTLLETYSADTFRMACLMSNYRYPMEFTDEVMKTAEEVLNKFKFFLKDAYVYVNNNATQSADYADTMLDILWREEEANLEALKADFDTATCINSLLFLISSTHKIIKADTAEFYPVPIVLIADYITNFLTKLGLKLQDTSEQSISNSLIDTLVEFRHSVRTNALGKKDKELLSACDVVRDKMKSLKVQINDSNKTASWVFTK